MLMLMLLSTGTSGRVGLVPSKSSVPLDRWRYKNLEGAKTVRALTILRRPARSI
jgi:hypothetical protein